MSKSSGSGISLGCLWPILFICLKLANAPGVSVWSWFWVLLAPIPLITEFVKVLLR